MTAARRADVIGKQREIESAIANFRAAAAETLVEEQTKAAQLLARQDALRGKVRHAEVRAPLSGTVSAVHVKTVGAVVQAGTMLAEIVPSEAEYLVRAQINPQDIADVQPGQVARISLAADDPSRYGVVMGWCAALPRTPRSRKTRCRSTRQSSPFRKWPSPNRRMSR